MEGFVPSEAILLGIVTESKKKKKLLHQLILVARYYIYSQKRNRTVFNLQYMFRHTNVIFSCKWALLTVVHLKKAHLQLKMTWVCRNIYCKLKTVVSFLRVIVTLLSLRPFGNIIFTFLNWRKQDLVSKYTISLFTILYKSKKKIAIVNNSMHFFKTKWPCFKNIEHFQSINQVSDARRGRTPVTVFVFVFVF